MQILSILMDSDSQAYVFPYLDTHFIFEWFIKHMTSPSGTVEYFFSSYCDITNSK